MIKEVVVLLGFLTASLYSTEVLIDDDFTSPKGNYWQEIRIFMPFSNVVYGGMGLVMGRNEKQTPIPGKLFDTAFELKSQPLILPTDARAFQLTLKLGSNKKGISPKGFGDSYQNRILWFDAEGKRLGAFYYIPCFDYPLDEPGWCLFRGAIPRGAVKAEVQFGFDTPDFLDGEKGVLNRLSFIVGTEAQIQELAAPCVLPHTLTLLSKSPTEDGKAPVVFAVSNPKAVDWNGLSVKLDGLDVSGLVKVFDDQLTLMPQGSFGDGLHVVEATLKDKMGETVTEKGIFYVGKSRKENVMTLREDGMPLLDGKPFFMLGIACLVRQGRNGNNYDRAFEEASAAGLNFARHWSTYNMDSKDADEFVAAARKHNMFISMSPTLVQNDIDAERVAKGIVKQLDVDRILAWDIGDDTSAFIKPADLLAKHNAIRAVDDTRLTTQADNMGLGCTSGSLNEHSSYTDYVLASDTIQPEIYPIREYLPGTAPARATMVPQVIRDMKQIRRDWQMKGAAPRPIWPLIQYFYYAPSKRSWYGLPTPQELRAMSYLAVIHGSHGVFWYRYAGYRGTENASRGYSDEQWKNLSTVTLEFRALYDMYCTTPVEQTQTAIILDGPQKDGLGFDSINTLLKKHDGKSYLITCNSAYQEVKARFDVPGVKCVEEYFEKRELPMKETAFEDSFAPYGVHVYVME
ncbi:MAG: hypothetical protein IKP00_17750 [Victivallales bacterium]|nr:hypothetical protein [Victivallales bacterium]